MLEVEAKYRVADWSSVVALLMKWGAQLAETREDTDHYFNAPDRDFAKTDEAFRLRRIGTKNYFTYKGPKRDTVTKTRTEIELPIDSGNDGATKAVKMIIALGYRPVAVVSKNRTVYKFHRGAFAMEACLDDIGSIGRFVELEIQSSEADYEAAKTTLLAAAAELGLKDQERRSYLEMLLSANRS